MARLKPLKEPIIKEEPKLTTEQAILRAINDKLLAIHTEDVYMILDVLNSLSPWLNYVPKKITRNASNYITKIEYLIGDRILEVTYTLDANNYLTEVTPRWKPLRKFT